jgi:phosphoglycerate dehydrogenase-like enzyme
LRLGLAGSANYPGKQRLLLSDKDAFKVEILLVDELSRDAFAWLAERHSVEYRPELARDQRALRKAIYNVRALVLPRRVPVTAEFLDFAPLLVAVGRLHVSNENTDIQACRARNIRIVQPSTATVRSNAEYLLGGLLVLMRRGMLCGTNGERPKVPPVGRELSGSTIGIFGLAPAAHTLTVMLKSLGAKLIGYDPAVHHTAPIWEQLQVEPLGAKDVLAAADAVTVSVLFGSRYRGLINDALLAHCKLGQIWVGTTRSALFDGAALAKALGDGRIEACMLDGAEEGFASKGTPLHGLENLYLTPRIGGYTHQAHMRASWYVAHRIDETLTLPRASMIDQITSAPGALTNMSIDNSDPNGPRFDIE